MFVLRWECVCILRRDSEHNDQLRPQNNTKNELPMKDCGCPSICKSGNATNEFTKCRNLIQVFVL